ncbi:MAG TPA: sensor histidine kinase N-terminal domain-containing protein, partial [Casimicrobiaceae bacterium]|nr:sensor histidine kinase N-terminal domain-containing protein [Casimicrobiaceae bacterium]
MRRSPPRGQRDAPTLRATLLRWLLIPLSVLLVVDALGSHVIARRLADRVYDGELLEIARELALHVHPGTPQPTFDLEKDAERTLLLDQYDKVGYVVRAGTVSIAGDATIPPPAR